MKTMSNICNLNDIESERIHIILHQGMYFALCLELVHPDTLKGVTLVRVFRASCPRLRWTAGPTLTYVIIVWMDPLRPLPRLSKRCGNGLPLQG